MDAIFKLRDYQQAAVDAGYKYLMKKNPKPGVIVAPTGCHAAGTMIPLFTGGFKKVEDIQIGDKLIGDDGLERTVLKLHQGNSILYEITPVKGEPFIVNEDHILALYRTREDISQSLEMRIEYVTVKDYIGKAEWFKHIRKLFKPKCVYFDNGAELDIDPYFIGIFLGDGSSASGVSITTRWEEVVEYCYQLAPQYDTHIRVAIKNNGDNKAKSYFFVMNSSNTRRDVNNIAEILKKYRIWGKVAGNKEIPEEYLFSSVENRYRLLAGFIDTDTHYDPERNGYEYCSKSYKMIKQVQFLCRSLGLYANIGVTKVVKGEKYYRMQIFGDLNKIPNRVKIRNGKPRSQKKNERVCGFTVKEYGYGFYYGFEIDGNHLYCDAQLFVHHNSGKSLIISYLAKELNAPVLVLQPSKEILLQNYAKAVAFGAHPTIYSASCDKKDLSEMTYATIGSIKKRVDDLASMGLRYVLVDEVHSGYSAEEGSEFMKFIGALPGVKVLGFTATPCRLHSYGSLVEGNYSSLNMLMYDDPSFFKEMVHVIQIEEMVKRGYWAKLRYEVWDFDESDLMLNGNGSEYTTESIARSIITNGVNNTIYKRLNMLWNERKHILVCMDSVENCNIISEFINKKRGAVVTGVVSAETPKKKREQILEDFKSGKLKVVFNYSTLATGFDFPELDCVMFGRPTFSFAIYYQFFGRVVRPHKDKPEGFIIDCCNNFRRFGPVEKVSIEHIPYKGWCMFSGEKLISCRMDRDIYKPQLLEYAEKRKRATEEAKHKPKEEGWIRAGAKDPTIQPPPGQKMIKDSNMLMWFGKYKGTPLEQVPLDYLKWVSENLGDSTNIARVKEYYNRIKGLRTV